MTLTTCPSNTLDGPEEGATTSKTAMKVNEVVPPPEPDKPWTYHTFYQSGKLSKAGRLAFEQLYKASDEAVTGKKYGPEEGKSRGKPPDDAYKEKNYELLFDKPENSIYIPRSFLYTTDKERVVGFIVSWFPTLGVDINDANIDSWKAFHEDLMVAVRDVVGSYIRIELAAIAQKKKITCGGTIANNWPRIRKAWTTELTLDLCEKMYYLLYTHWKNDANYDRIVYKTIRSLGFWHSVAPDDKSTQKKSTFFAVAKATFGDRFRKNLFKSDCTPHGVKVIKDTKKNNTDKFCKEANLKGWNEPLHKSWLANRDKKSSSNARGPASTSGDDSVKSLHCFGTFLH